MIFLSKNIELYLPIITEAVIFKKREFLKQFIWLEGLKTELVPPFPTAGIIKTVMWTSWRRARTSVESSVAWVTLPWNLCVRIRKCLWTENKLLNLIF